MTSLPMPTRCRSLYRRADAIPLGQSFAKQFAQHSASLGKGEIPLFQAMQASLTGIASTPHLTVEEYHGPNHQVSFKGTGTYSRQNARCELSDLMTIVYDRQLREARLTYIQAKSERTVQAGNIVGKSLTANLEQWDLLARRPTISPAPGPFGKPSGFKPPPDLLAAASLRSVGSFVFFLHGQKGADIYYAAASMLKPPHSTASRTGKLTIPADTCACTPHPECLSVYGAANFGAFLFASMIGTPILMRGLPVDKLSTWLSGQLRAAVANAANPNAQSSLAIELAGLLAPDSNPTLSEPAFGARSLLLIGLGPSGTAHD